MNDQEPRVGRHFAASGRHLAASGQRRYRDETHRNTIHWGPAFVALAVGRVWAGLYVQRGTAHTPNVDDYLYTRVAYTLGHLLVARPLSGVHAVLLTGQTAPLVPVVAALPTHLAGVQGAVGVELLFQALVVCGAYILARVWVSPTASVVVALVAGLNQAVLGWALMLNFAVAAAAATVWTFAC